ncbi:MAG: hypothetical protein IJ111_10165 [Eggerthellaceae bacterium]|nr:hypothetical protein [Eggerthellaceae bacterium]
MTTAPKITLVECRFDEATDDSPGHHAVSRNWREDSFVDMLEAIGCSSYGHPEESSVLAPLRTPFDKDDEMRHFVVDTPIFTLRPYYWGDCHAVYALPNFVYKPWNLEISWHKYPMRYAHANIALSDGDWKLMCNTVVRMVSEYAKSGTWPNDMDDAPRMNEIDEVAWDLRKTISAVASQRNELEDALFALWRDPTSVQARDDAARLLAVGPYSAFDADQEARARRL